MQVKRLALFFNTQNLGGAERSMILQSKKLSRFSIDVFIPLIEKKSQTNPIEACFKKEGINANFIYYHYPKGLYQFSRTNRFIVYFSFLAVLFHLTYLIINFFRLGVKKYDCLWINGNKVGLPILLFSIFFKYKNTIVYHFRDYPSASGLFKVLWYFLDAITNKLILVANSYDVKKSVEGIMKNKCVIDVCYNPVECLNFRKENKELIISSASMLVPWKGVHQLVIMEKMYRNELLSLGVKAIHIYGENIYLTDAVKMNYAAQLKLITSEDSLIKYKGNCDPSEIFQSTKILIHPSCEPEPFGRIIAEAYESGVAVISSGLGGSGELIDDGKSGLLFIPNDYHDLFLKISKLCIEDNFKEIVKNGFLKSKEISAQQEQFWRKIDEVI